MPRTLLARLSVTGVGALILSGCLQIMPMIAPTVRDVEPGISADFPYERQFVDVNGSRMAYVEAGEGDPILLIHGNPTNAYLWRNVIPHLTDSGRVIAVEMIGFGGSDKPDIDYTFEDHARYIASFIEAMALTDVTLVMHDWGGGVGLDYAARHPDNVNALVFMEAVIRPMAWSEATLPERMIFGTLRDPERGFEVAAEDNYFVEQMLPMLSGRALSETEMAAYRAPFPTVESRRPVAQWPREIPIGGEPADTVSRIGDNYEWLVGSDVPVLLLYAEPGMIVKPRFREQMQSAIPRMDTAPVGEGLHFIQETQPTAIGEAIADWLAGQ